MGREGFTFKAIEDPEGIDRRILTSVGRWTSHVGLSFTAVLYLAVSVLAADIPKLADQLTTGDRDVRREASHQLMLLGGDAKPALVSLIKALDDEDRQVWSNSVATIAAIGPDAKDAIPRLVATFDSSKSRGFGRRGGGQTAFRASHALAQIGDAAKPTLLEALKSQDSGMCIGATRALGTMRAKEAIPGLIDNLDDPELDVRVESAEALGLIGTEAVQALSGALDSTDAKAREFSARALTAMGKHAAPASAGLLKAAAGDKESAVRIAALGALPKLGLEQEQVVPTLISAFKESDEALQRAATNALLMVRPAAKTAVPAVMAMLSDSNLSARAATALGRYGSEAKAAVPALLDAALKSQPPAQPFLDAVAAIGAPSVPAILTQVEKLKPADLGREHWAIRTLVSISSAALPQLEKALTSPSASVRLAAICTINEFGDEARDARSAVLKLAGDSEPAVRATVLSALASLGVKPQQALETLDSGTRDAASVVRLAAANAAGAIGPSARPLTARLSELLDDPDNGVRAASLRAVASLGAGDPALGQKIAARLDDANLRLTAIEALGKLGATSPEVAAKLASLYTPADKPTRLAILSAIATGGDAARSTLDGGLKDPDAEVRAAAVRAFAKGKTPLDVFVPILVTVLSDSDAGVRQAALVIIAEFGERQSDKLAPLVQPLLDLTKADADRANALDALREMRIRNLDVLTIALASPVVETRTWAVERLGRIGRDARPIRDKIEPLLSDSNDYVRRATRRALEAIGK